MPAPPKFYDAVRAIRAEKIERETNSKTASDSDRNQTVTGEVIINSQAEDQVRHPDQINIRS